MSDLPRPLFGIVLKEEFRKSARQTWFFSYIVKTQAGKIKMTKWNVPPQEQKTDKYPHEKNVICVTDFRDERDKGSVVIVKWNPINQEDIPESCQKIFDVPRATKDEMNVAWATIRDDERWKDTANYSYTMDLLEKLDQKKLNLCAAGAKRHHTCQGGLIIHTAEVLQISESIAKSLLPRYNFINTDVLYCSCITHDVGKIDTYSQNEDGESISLNEEYTHGHSYYSMLHIDKSDYAKFGVSDEFIKEVKHCIAAHMGELKHGAIVEARSIEAYILSMADTISSKVGGLEIELVNFVEGASPLPETYISSGDNKYSITSGIKEYYKKLA